MATEPGPDLVSRLRDALGVVRTAWVATEDEGARAVLQKAGEDLRAAIEAAKGARPEELGPRLDEARRSLQRAVDEVPGASQVLAGALGRLRDS